MGARGRKSAASMAIVQPDGISAIVRPSPPDDLTDEQAHEWRAVVNRMPADWFPRETHPLLAAYCRHIVNARRISDLIEDFLANNQEGDNWIADYERLLKMQDREGRSMSSLATRMRVSQHAQYNVQKKTGPKIKKPF